jgi:RNA polymerase sigma factor (sigma-70 family)
MTARDEFELLMTACRRGEPAAVAELVRRYLPLVRAAVRKKLPTTLRGRFDSLDFAQDVWLSFFHGAAARKEAWDEITLVGYLTKMAHLKVAEEYRHQTTRKVGLTRDTPLEAVVEPVGPGPTPSAGVLADDTWERLTAGLPDRDRALLRMLRDGHTHAETAAAFGLSEKTVQRLVRRILPPDPLP